VLHSALNSTPFNSEGTEGTVLIPLIHQGLSDDRTCVVYYPRICMHGNTIFKSIAQSLLTVSMYSLRPNENHAASGRTSRLTEIRDFKKRMQF